MAVLDTNADRLARAVEFGVDQAVPAGADLADLAPDILLECTGVPDVVRTGIEALRPAGTAVLVGMGPHREQAVPVAAMQSRELTVTGTFRYANTYPAAIALVAAGRLSLGGLVGARLPLERTEEALRMARTDPAIVKTIVAVDAG